MAQSVGLQKKVQLELRSHKRRQPGVEYTLQLIDGSGGMLELVEKPPVETRSYFQEWARALQHSHWG